MDVKKLFINALIDLLREYSFEEITVQMLLNRSTLSRATFYRYYKDKYDLLNGYYEEKLQAILTDPSTDTLEDGLIRIYHFLYENRDFFKKVLQSKDTNSLYDYLYTACYEYMKRAVLSNTGSEELTAEQRIKLEYIAKGQAHLVRIWMLRDNQESITDMAKWTYESIPRSYQICINQFIRNQQNTITG